MRQITVDGTELMLVHRTDEFITLYPNGIYDVIKDGENIGKVYRRRRKLHFKPAGRRFIMSKTSAEKWFWNGSGRLEADTMKEAAARVLLNHG